MKASQQNLIAVGLYYRRSIGSSNTRKFCPFVSMSTVHSAHYMARHIKVLVLHGWGQDGTMGQRALHHLTMHLAMAGTEPFRSLALRLRISYPRKVSPLAAIHTAGGISLIIQMIAGMRQQIFSVPLFLVSVGNNLSKQSGAFG